MKIAAILLTLCIPPLAGCVSVPRVANDAQACVAAKNAFTKHSGFPAARITLCDHIGPARNPPGYFVMALHSDRECDSICSTNLGWFAVRKSTGEVFDWDVAQWVLGQAVEP